MDARTIDIRPHGRTLIRVKTHLLSVVTLVLALSLARAARADPEPDNPTMRGPFVELNLAPFVFHGYSGFAGYQYGHVQVGAGAYAFHLPAFIRDSGFRGADGLDVRSKLGLAAFGRYFLKPQGTGVYGALQLGWERFGFARNHEESLAYETYVYPYVGYVWKPWHRGFYLNPSFGLAFSTTTSGTFAVDGQSYRFKGYVPLLFFQIGYVLESR